LQSSSLAGFRIIEIGTMLAAPFAAHILGQLGAEIIKIEPPAGDPTRSLVRGGPSGTFIAYSFGKKSVCMDLYSAEGQEAFRTLLATADVLVHNLAPGSARRLKLTREDCQAVKPKLVYCHIRGYGPGPLENELASNPVAEASTGVMEANVVNGRPSRLGPSYHDQFAGAYAVIGILSALMQARQQAPAQTQLETHTGECVEIGLYETGLHVAARDLAGVQLKTQIFGRPEREPNGEFSMPGYGAYRTADDRWIYLLMLNDGHWAKFCDVLGLAQATDDSLKTLRLRKKRFGEVEAIVKGAIGAQSYETLAARFGQAGFGFTEVMPIETVLTSPQAQVPGKLANFALDGLNFEVPVFPRDLREDAPQAGPPPRLGEHTAAVLLGAGVAPTSYARLIATGAVKEAELDGPLWALASVEARQLPTQAMQAPA
jgi:crotonobetainyl-CoA:carnitine CoA-transferase CaiB-like acyl-CoA transferase